LRERRGTWLLVAGAGVALLVAAGCGGAATSPPSTAAASGAAPATVASNAGITPASAVTLQSLLAPGATVQPVTTGLRSSEGPLWLPDGRLLVSDITADAVVAVDSTGATKTFRRSGNGANGHALDLDGSMLEAEAGDAEHRGGIARIAADGNATMLADNYQGKRFNSPNDLVVKRDGTIWFTDPDYERKVDPEIGFTGVFRLDPATKTVTLVTDKLVQPNGIAFSPDEKTLYVSGSLGLVSYPVAADDSVGAEHVPFDDTCDGIGVDEQGNVWGTTCASKIVTVTDPAGVRIGEIAVPGIATNVGWGGADGKTMFITTQEGGVYRISLAVSETH
jgi:gluconolactonase